MYEWVAHCEPASGLFEMMRAELERERLAREIAEEDAKDAKAEVRSLRNTLREIQMNTAEQEMPFAGLVQKAQDNNEALGRHALRLRQSVLTCAPGSGLQPGYGNPGTPGQVAAASKPVSSLCRDDAVLLGDGAVLLTAIQRLGSSLGFTASGVPVAAVLLFRSSYYVEDLRAETAHQLELTLSEAARHAANADGNASLTTHNSRAGIQSAGNLQALAYWLSSTAWLMTLLQAHAVAPGPIRSSARGANILDASLTSSSGSHSPCSAAPGATEQAAGTPDEDPDAATYRRLMTPGLCRRMLEAAMALQGPLVGLVGGIRANATDRFLPLLDALVIPLPATEDKGAQSEGQQGPGTCQGPAAAVLSCLSDTFAALKANLVPAVIVRVLYQQLTSMADVWLLNKLLLRRELCGAATLGPLAEHLNTMATAPSMCENLGVQGLVLPRTTQAVKLLLRPEDLDLHPTPEDAAGALFPALGGPQVLRLAHNAKAWAPPSAQLPPASWLEPEPGRRGRLHLHIAPSARSGTSSYLVDPRPELRTQAQLGGGGRPWAGTAYAGSAYGSVPNSPGSCAAPPSPAASCATLTGARQMDLGLDVAAAGGTFVSLPSAVLLLEHGVDYNPILWRGH